MSCTADPGGCGLPSADATAPSAGHGRPSPVGRGDAGELDEPGAVLVLGAQGGGGLHRQAGLARPASGGVATQLDGFRGAAALDRAPLRELTLRFALLLGEVPEVVEADLNSVRCTTNSCVVLDMRLRIGRRRPVERVQTW